MVGDLKIKTIGTGMKNALKAAKKPFIKAARTTVLVAGLALVGAATISPVAGCDTHYQINHYYAEQPKAGAANGRQPGKNSHEVDVSADKRGKDTVSGPVGAGGLMYGNTQLVDANGAPVVKVIIGNKSKPADILAAALIVQTLAANTYQSIRLTAQVTGTATRSAEPVSTKCSVDMNGFFPVIMPYNAQSVIIAKPYKWSYGNLLVLDSDAAGVSTVVSVGGPKENSVTASLLAGSSVDWIANPVVVKEIVSGSKIVVAGATPDHTLSAAKDFVSQLKKE